jgi:arylsulfatase A-like enzyme
MTSETTAPAKTGKPSERSDLARAVCAGLLGGALAGLADGVVAIAAGGAGAKGPLVPLLGAGLGALFGAALAAGFAALAGVLERAAPRTGRGAIFAAGLLAGPVLIYDAIALFAGPQARTLPFRHGLSVLVALLGIAGVALAAAIYRRLLQTRAPVRGALVAVLATIAALAFVANRVVLPRLYPWFHATLALVVVVAVVLAARAVLAGPLRARLSTALVALAAVVFGAGYVLVGRSQGLRFVVYQRTQLIGLGLQVLPPAPGSRVRPERRVAHDRSPLPEGPHRPNADVVVITIDALRPDHVGAYGYPRKTTPSIDALAAGGVRFSRAYTSAPNTSFASTSWLTGKYYPTLGRLQVPDGMDTLPLLLRRYGWKTAAFYPPAVFYIAGDQLKAYRDSNYHFEYVKVGDFSDAEARVDQILGFLATEKPPRAFLWVHFFEPHEPYERWPGHDFGTTDRDRYDSEIAYVDRAVGRLVTELRRQRPNAIVILTADHGEEFDEHGGRYHGTTLFEEQVRVPLVIAVPGLPAQVVEGPVELVDLAPTILGLLDIPIPLRMRGTDLGPWLGQPPAPNDRLPPAFAEVHDLRMVATAADKLICDAKRDFCSYYDLRTDPGERTNQAEARPERVAVLRAELDGWLADSAALEARGNEDAPTGAAARALERARLGDPAAAAGIAALLSARASVAIRREAARLLVTNLAPRPETQAAVLAASRDADAEVAAWATVAAARLGDPSARARLLAELSAEAGPETKEAGGDARADRACNQRQVQGALALAGQGERKAVPTLVTALRACSDPGLDAAIVQALGRLPDRRATDTLIEHLPVVVGRADVVAALGAIADPRSIAALSERLRSDEYVPVRVAAATALGAIGGAEARAALTQAARLEREATVKAAIAEALARLR